MIPDGTPPDVIVFAVVTVMIVACSLMAALFWFTLPKQEGPSLRDSVLSLFAMWAHRTPIRTTADELVHQWFEPAEPLAVRGQQHQLEPDKPAEIEPAYEPARLYRLSRQEEIVILAIQHDASGAYRHSANDITKLMGGTAADVKEQIRAIRDPKPVHEPPAPARVERPANGWDKA